MNILLSVCNLSSSGKAFFKMFARLLIGAIFCSVFVGCFGYENKRQSIIVEEIEDQEEQCTDYKTALKNNMMNFKCMPRDTVVRLSHKKSHFKMYPDIAVVKRCYNIGCQGNKTCMPSKMMKRKVAVRVTDKLGNNHPRCSWINVIEHTECACGCDISADDCTGMNKMYNPADCTCKCRNEHIQRRECNLKENMIWDEEKCICTCPPGGMQCSTGRTWVPQFCRCMDVDMNQQIVKM